MRGKLVAVDNEDWNVNALRSGTLPKWSPPTVRRIHTWVDALSDGGDPILTVVGPDPLLRNEVFKVCYQVPDLQVVGSARNTQDWLQKGVLDDITGRVRAITGRPWGLIWDLIDVEDFIVEEPLRGLIDQGFSFTGLFKALWETRFLVQEGRKPESLVLLGAVLRWLASQDLSPEQQAQLEKVHIDRELVSVQERLDMLLFLLALAYQNGLADRAIFVFDGLERVVRSSPIKRKELIHQLTEATTALTRWSRLGSATGVVFGLDESGGAIDALSQYSDRLGKLVAGSLV